MNESICQIQFDPTFLEEAVFLFARSRAEDSLVKDYHIQREEVYNRQESSSKDLAFRELHACYFVKLGLMDIFEKSIRGFPLLADRNLFIFFKRVFRRKDEGSQLFVRGQFRTVSMGLQVLRILDQIFLETFLYHELLRTVDMLDPGFQYSPDVQFAGENEIENNFIRDRFRFLWDLHIDARLKNRGYIPAISLDRKREIFLRLFLHLKTSGVETIYTRLVNEDNLTQAELLGYAQGSGILAKC